MHSCNFALKRVLHCTHIPETKKTRHFSKDWHKNMCKKFKKLKYNNQYPTNFASNTLNSEFRDQFYQKYSSMGFIYKQWILKYYALNNFFLTFRFNHCFILLICIITNPPIVDRIFVILSLNNYNFPIRGWLISA